MKETSIVLDRAAVIPDRPPVAPDRPSVIPSAARDLQFLPGGTTDWVPACAGMTEGAGTTAGAGMTKGAGIWKAVSRRSVAAALLGIVMLTGPGFPQEPAGPAAAAAPESRVSLTPEQNRAAEAAMSRLRSPYTGSHTVDMCPSAPALRDSIRVAAASGLSTDEMVEDVIARHGEHLRILPKRSGAGLVAWLATPLLLLIGGGLIVARLRRDGAAADVEPRSGAEDDITDAERERLAAAMRSFEETGGMEP